MLLFTPDLAVAHLFKQHSHCPVCLAAQILIDQCIDRGILHTTPNLLKQIESNQRNFFLLPLQDICDHIQPVGKIKNTIRFPIWFFL